MKNTFLLFLLLLLTFGVCAQIPKGYELLETIEEGKLLVVQKKGKEGLYSLDRNEFVIKPGNFHFFYVQRHSCLFQVDVKKGITAFHNVPFTDSLRKIASHQNSILFGINQSYDFTLDKRLFREQDWEEIKTIPEIYQEKTAKELNQYHFKAEKFGVRIALGQFIECIDFKDLGEEYIIPLIAHDGYDSIDANGNMVYPPRDPAILKSGVWDIKKQDWTFPQSYKDFYWVESYCFALNGDVYNNYELPFYYDVIGFEKGNEVYRKDSILDNSAIPFDRIFPKKIEYISRDSLYIVFDESGKKGLHSFYLFDTPYNFPIFSYREVLPAKYNAVIESGHSRMYYTQEGATFNRFEIGEDRWCNVSWKNQFLVDHQEYEASAYNVDDLAYSDANSSLEGCSNSEFLCLLLDSNSSAIPVSYADIGMKVLSDSLLYIKYVEEEGDFIPLVTIWGEDSVDENGNIWYYPPYPGVYRSGIYNRLTHRWTVTPQYEWIVRNKGGFVMARPLLDKNDNIRFDDNEQAMYLYSFQKNDGTLEFEDISGKEFHNKYYHLAIWDANADRIIENKSLNATHMFYSEGEKMGLANRMTKEKITEPRDYIKCFDRFHRISVVNDQLMIENDNGAIYLPMNKDFSLMNYSIFSANSYGNHGYKIQYVDSVIVVQDGCYRSDPNDTLSPNQEITKSPYALNYQSFKGNLKSVSSDESYGVFRLINTKDVLLIHDMKTEMFAFPLIDMWGEDSIDMNGNYVYPPEKNFPYSGVYHKESKKWIVPLQYEFVRQFQNLFYAEYKNGENYLYDVYNWKGEKIETIDLEAYDKLIRTSKKMESFDVLTYWFEDEQLVTSSYGEVHHFSLTELKKIIINTRYETGGYDFWFYAINENDTSVYYPNIISHENDFHAPNYMFEEIDRGENLMFKKINDSLLYVENFRDEYQVEIGLLDMYGFDSIDFNGNLVYPDPDPQEFKSGIYNFKSNKWVVPNNYRRIVYKEGAFYGELLDEQKNKYFHQYNTFGVLINEKAKLD